MEVGAEEPKWVRGSEVRDKNGMGKNLRSLPSFGLKGAGRRK